MRHSLSIFLIALAQAICAALLMAPGCSVNGYPELTRSHDGGAGGGPEPPDAGIDDASGEEPLPASDGGDGGPSSVLIGVTPTPASASPSGPTEGETFAALLTTVAAGARCVVISRSWIEIEESGLGDVASQIDFYSKHGTQVLFNLAFVDRKRDARPAGVAGLSWDDPDVKAALEGAVDKVLLELGAGLSILTLGRDVDVFLAAHPADRDAIVALASHASEHARKSESAPDGLRVAIGASFEGIAVKPEIMASIALAGDVVALSYIPGQSGEIVAPTTEVAKHLDQMIALASAAQKPIVLEAVGYPSEPFMQSSAVKQELFFKAFFSALLPRRGSFFWVNIHELHDRWPKACAAYAEGQGEPPDGPTASFACSLGLFTSAGEQKPAWSRVLEGAATFASP